MFCAPGLAGNKPLLFLARLRSGDIEISQTNIFNIYNYNLNNYFMLLVIVVYDLDIMNS